MTTGSILVVDDDKNIREMVVRYLSKQGYQLSAATSGEEALVFLDKPFDLLITDFQMPGISGLELAKRALKANPDCPVILMTAYADVENARQAVTIGVYDVILKPFDITDFGNAVDRAIKHRQVVLQNQEYQRTLEKMVEDRTRELNQKVKELEGRNKINNLLATMHPLEEILNTIVDALQSVLEIERIVIFISDLSKQDVIPEMGTGINTAHDFILKEDLKNILDDWFQDACDVGKQVLIQNKTIPIQGESGICCAALPLSRLGEVAGVIFVQNPFSNRTVTNQDLDTISGMTAQAAVAVNDALLYSDAERWDSVMDELGSLTNAPENC